MASTEPLIKGAWGKGRPSQPDAVVCGSNYSQMQRETFDYLYGYRSPYLHPRAIVGVARLPVERGDLKTMEQVQVATSLAYPEGDNLNPRCLRGDDVFRVLERGIMRSAILVDVHNLYLGSTRKYPGKVVNYPALCSYYASLGNSLFHKYAFGRQPEDKVAQFAKMLRRNGFRTMFGQVPYTIDMTLKVVDLIQRRAMDHLILGTSSFEAVRILDYARSYGIYTTVVGFEVPRLFESVAEVMEIPPDLLQDRPTEEATA